MGIFIINEGKEEDGFFAGQGIRLFYCKTAGSHGRGWALAALPL